MALTTGTVVRYDNGRGTGPAAGTEQLGKIVRTDSAIGWPVVYFPDAWGPYSEFACMPSTLTAVDASALSPRMRRALGV